MKILFLDDDQQRIEKMKRECIGHALDWTTTASGAIKVLEGGVVYDIVSLDHDLGGQQMQISSNGTGYEVARFISQMDTPPEIVVIHSFNPVGAQNMYHIMRNVSQKAVIPFGSVMYWNIYDRS